MEIFFDTETTGLDPAYDEILSLAIVDGRGNVLFDERFRPEHHAEWPEAMAVNGITPEDVADCDTFRDRAGEVRAIFEGADKVTGYNVRYDLSMLKAAGVEPPDGCEIHDTMPDFAELYGEPNTNPRRPGEWKWQRLVNAAATVGHEWTGEAHGALADTLATLCVQRWCDERREEAKGYAKERVVFDRESYDDHLAATIVAEREGMTEDKVRQRYSDGELWEEAWDLLDTDFETEVEALSSFLSDNGRRKGGVSANALAGNHLIVKGTVNRWDGPTSGLATYESIDAALDCSPSRFGLGNVFADCEIDKICDVNGRLFVSGHHHDGSVEVEIRQLTDAGEKRLAEGGDLGTLWDEDDDNELSARPCFMEKAYGCHAFEYGYDSGIAAAVRECREAQGCEGHGRHEAEKRCLAAVARDVCVGKWLEERASGAPSLSAQREAATRASEAPGHEQAEKTRVADNGKEH